MKKYVDIPGLTPSPTRTIADNSLKIAGELLTSKNINKLGSVVKDCVTWIMAGMTSEIKGRTDWRSLI